jgi:hypothetical protein
MSRKELSIIGSLRRRMLRRLRLRARRKSRKNKELPVLETGSRMRRAALAVMGSLSSSAELFKIAISILTLREVIKTFVILTILSSKK